MIQWILEQLEKQPSTLFYETMLRDKNEEALSKLIDKGYLVCVQPNSVNERYSLGQTEPRVAVNLNGLYCAVDDEDPEADLLFLNRDDLIKYRFSFEIFAKELAIANGFSSSPYRLHRRLYYAGDRTIDKNRTALVLAFIDKDKNAENSLLGLPGRFSSGFQQFFVVMPSYTVKSPKLRERLERQQIFVTTLEDFKGFKIDLSLLIREGYVMLTPEQERDYELFGYKCRLPIHITGNIAVSGSNLVEVGNVLVEIGDVPFCLFLRLLLELRGNKAGIVTKNDLVTEGYLNADSEFQSIGRLRECFVRALGDLHPNKLIEGYRPKTLRLSVHPELVTWDAVKLSDHDDCRVRELVQQLIQTSKPDSPLPT